MFFLYILLFLFSCFLIAFASKKVIVSLIRVSRFLGWKEFVVSFFIMALAGSIPNFFVGISSALNKVPQLSFGDVAGNNIVAFTLTLALAVLFSPRKEIAVESRTALKTSIFTLIAAIFPIILTLDKILSRSDGLLLISFFVFYIFWLFSKKERFSKIYEEEKEPIIMGVKIFIKDLIKIVFNIAILLVASYWVVISAQFFAKNLDVSIIFIGILITGLGNALPEIYFTVISARRGETWMILGDLMGAVIFPATLVLGIVALISPIYIYDFSHFYIARLFLIISAILFAFFIRTNKKISFKEGLSLLFIYILFTIVEIFQK